MTNTEPNTKTRTPRRMACPAEPATTNADAGDDCGSGSSKEAEPAPPPRTTKAGLVLDLLRRPNGALLVDIVAATGWLPHTARAALTGLKKKGHTIVSTKVDKLTRYTLA